MELMPILRAQAPLPAQPPAAGTARNETAPGEVATVAAGQSVDALHPLRSSMIARQTSLAPTDEDGHPATTARAAAEAARQAYIQASRAAGISPLPLP